MYTNYNAILFANDLKSTTKPPSSDYSKWIVPTSMGLSYKALNLLSDSVRGQHNQGLVGILWTRQQQDRYILIILMI